MSLPKRMEKQWENVDLRVTKQNTYRSKGFGGSYPKMLLLLNLSHCVKSYGIYVKFYYATNQIWSCHLTMATNFEYFYFLPNFILNFRKSDQIWEKLAQERKSYRRKTKFGEENTPSAYRVRSSSLNLCSIMKCFILS